MNAKILLAEDDEIMRVTLFDRLRRSGWQVTEVEDGHRALKAIENETYDLVLSDVRMPGLDGRQLLERIIAISPETDVILMTAFGGMEDAVACMKLGAADYILKPFDMDDLAIRIRRLLDMKVTKLRLSGLEQSCRPHQPAILGSSPATRNLLKLIAKVTGSEASVLITGESGTGKELVAAAIHFGSHRAGGPYVRVNCAAIPEGLIESELFGHEKGAFTGALNRKPGRFELASGGTILLDEIGDLPLHLQAKLLRVLQERELERVGGTSPISIDVRVICATARKLEEEVKKGNFREDLYYRLRVVPIEVPPLRQRKE
ncbi:MAG: sigma-54 dependent transcriptional regulator, partial [Thermodesulfobacteriota bacterium]